MKSLISLFTLFVCTSDLWAHPVSYKDAYGIMPTIMSERRDLELNYSFTASQAIGLSLIQIEQLEGDAEFLIPRYNQRIYRRNKIDSQLNVYLNLGLGSEINRDSGGATLLTGFQTDYETRRIYTLLSTEYLQNEGGEDCGSSRYRFGVAPYLADFESLHTWLIAQVDYNPELSESLMFSPVVRFFYKNYLLEVGSSLDGQLFVAGIFHF